MREAPAVEQLLAILDQAYDHRSWHGPNLRGAIRGLGPEQAGWRPAPGRHNIWEIVVHAAYWKYAVWRRLTGATRGSFPFKGSNWFERPGGQPSLKHDVELLEQMHRTLRDTVARLSPAGLGRAAKGSSQTPFFMISGAAAHDLYHAGQIQLLKRLQAGE